MNVATRQTEHPEDAAFLDGQPWAAGWLRNHCDRCTDLAATVGVGHIEATSGPGYEIRWCRVCIALHLARARAAAVRVGGGYVPALPRMSPT